MASKRKSSASVTILATPPDDYLAEFVRAFGSPPKAPDEYSIEDLMRALGGRSRGYTRRCIEDWLQTGRMVCVGQRRGGARSAGVCYRFMKNG